MRLTITRKIAIAVAAVTLLCVGTMVWITTQNLKHGFIAYLNEVQAKELDEVRDLLSEQYKQHGDFEWLRHNRRAMHDLLERRPIQAEREPPPLSRFDDRRRPPPPEAEENRPPPSQFGPRLSIIDESGHNLIGPPASAVALKRAIVVDGHTVGTLSLEPLRQIDSTTDSNFLRGQIKDLLYLASALVLASILLSIGLARHLLRPVAALRNVTQRIAQGRLDARAPILHQDELGDLAQNVNDMARALETNEQQRRKVLADVSHELRTPLSVVRGELEALMDGVRQIDAGAIQSLHAEVLQLTKLVDDLYQLALADAGDLHHQRQEIDLVYMLSELLERYRTRSTAAGLSLSVNLPTGTLLTQADPGRLKQVISNLLENSLRYTDRGGEISVKLSAQGRMAEFSVEDSAPGVPPGSYTRLFDRLYRVDHARSRAHGGSGLGLSICKALVEAYGGDIHAMPSALGGLKIVVRLPIQRKNGEVH